MALMGLFFLPKIPCPYIGVFFCALECYHHVRKGRAKTGGPNVRMFSFQNITSNGNRSVGIYQPLWVVCTTRWACRDILIL